MKETITDFKNRINRYNKLHGLTPGDADFIEQSEYKSAGYTKLYDTMMDKEKEEHCLYCGKYEKGHPDDVWYICSNCVIGLLDTPLRGKELLHKEAVESGNKQSAKALEIFSHVGGKDERPKRRRNKRKRLVR